MNFDDLFLKLIKNTKTYNSLYKIPLKLFKNSNPKDLNSKHLISKPIKILILTSTCNGFGDVIFSCKLKQYIKDWYGNLVQVKIATNSVNQFTSMGEQLQDLIHLKTKQKDTQCREFNNMKAFNGTEFINNNSLVPEDLNIFDLYFVAPITYDFSPNFKEIHSLVNNSNRFNTFFLCEYNYPIHKDILFNVGIGNDRLGIFLITPEFKLEKIPSLTKPYSIIYIAENDVHLNPCYEGFLELLTSKYKLPDLDVVCPPWMKYTITYEGNKIRRKINKHYSKISFVYKTNEGLKTEVLSDNYENKGKLTFRFDIFPVPFKTVLSLYQHSLPHVLLTGDQSITDFISLRYEDSVPFYQGLPWKQNFYTNLAKALPQKFFKSYKTSCGTLEAIKYNPKLTRFVKKNDFRINAKPLMDTVISSVGYNSEKYNHIKNTILSSRKLSVVKRKLKL